MVAEPGQRRAGQASNSQREMLARLGLAADASEQDIESARDAIVGYLEGAPTPLHAWARRQIALSDEAYGSLLDPMADPAAEPALDADDPHIAHGPGAAGRPRSERRVSREDGARPDIAAASAQRRGPLARVLIAALATAAVVTVGYAVYVSGTPAVPGFTGTPAPESSGSAIDLARVGELMQQLQANPKDTAALSELGDLYFQAGDYKTADDWMTKLLAVDPKNVSALLGLGAAKFNQGDSAGAETQWRAVIAIEPRNQEAYYDLGFMYLSKDPPDMANVRAMWDEVIAIDPTTDVAKTVKTHLDSFASASPGSSGSASAAPSASAPSPAPSPSGGG